MQLLVNWVIKRNFQGEFSPTCGIIALNSEMFILLYMASLVRFSCGIIICWKEILIISFSNELISYCMTTLHMCQNICILLCCFLRPWCGTQLRGIGRRKHDTTWGRIKIKETQLQWNTTSSSVWNTVPNSKYLPEPPPQVQCEWQHLLLAAFKQPNWSWIIQAKILLLSPVDSRWWSQYFLNHRPFLASWHKSKLTNTRLPRCHCHLQSFSQELIPSFPLLYP